MIEANLHNVLHNSQLFECKQDTEAEFWHVLLLNPQFYCIQGLKHLLLCYYTHLTCGVYLRFLARSCSTISGMSWTPNWVQWRFSTLYVGFDLPAGTFVRAANVSRAAHANDERGLHTLWHLSAQNLHFLTLPICPSHFTVGQFITLWYLQWALQALTK